MPKVKQPSRKTKSTWRKNIDLTGVEASLENQRAAERLGLAPITSNTHASSLFVEDRVGDNSIKKKAGKKPLKSLAILREKDEGSSPVIGRARRGVMDTLTKTKSGKGSSQNGLTPEQRAIKSGMSRKDLEKLRRTAGRNVKGAFGVIVDEDEEDGMKQRGPTALVGEENYDVWSSAPKAQSSTSALEESKQRNKPRKAPATLLEVRTKDVALPLPDQGQSYNPAAEAHEALLNKALQKAQAEEEARRKELEYKQKWDEAAKEQALTAKDGVERLIGMQVNAAEDEEESSDDDDEDDDETAPIKKLAKRKTKQQRAKAKKLKEEIRAREQVKASKRTRVQLQQLRALRQELLKVDVEHQENIAKRKEARQRKAEEKVGMFKLQKPEEEVQLGEDLAESLRGLKPEGNLLRDRIHAFQKRGLIEPKKQNVMKNNLKGLKRRQKEYEIHSYKRFK